MATLTLQLGQCGNQLGETFFESLNSEAQRARPALSSAIRRVYFSESSQGPLYARAVLCDTEPRVVSRCLQGDGRDRGAWGYRKASTYWRQGGAANNWAYGFNHHGPKVSAGVLERVRKEVEQCDRIESFLVFHSVAGGTGSGVGSHVLQLLRDSYPAKNLVAASIWPFESGEVSVQSYNATLSTVAAYEFADMVLLYENARYMDICRLALREANPSLESLNSAICSDMLHSLMPSKSASVAGTLAGPLLSLANQLCAHPAYRLVTTRALPQLSRGAQSFSSESWAALQKRMVRMCEAGSLVDRVALESAEADASRSCRSVASAAFLWGAGAGSAPLDGLRKIPVWPLALQPLQVQADSHEMRAVERSLGLLSNCRTVLPTLSATGAKAGSMLQASAYLHMYAAHGVGREEMSEALLSLAQIQHDYAQL